MLHFSYNSLIAITPILAWWGDGRFRCMGRLLWHLGLQLKKGGVLSLPWISGGACCFCWLRWGARCPRQFSEKCQKWPAEFAMFQYSSHRFLGSTIWATTLQGANIFPSKAFLKMMFLFPRWDMLVPWRVARRSSCISLDFCFYVGLDGLQFVDQEGDSMAEWKRTQNVGFFLMERMAPCLLNAVTAAITIIVYFFLLGTEYGRGQRHSPKMMFPSKTTILLCTMSFHLFVFIVFFPQL